MEKTLLYFCLALIGCVLAGHLFGLLAEALDKIIKALAQVTTMVATLAVIVVLFGPLVLGPKRTAAAGEGMAKVIQQVAAAWPKHQVPHRR